MRYRGEFRPAIRRGSIREFFGSDPNLKGCWSLDGHTQDHSGNGNHGTVTGAVPHIGKFHNSYYFNGVSGNINVGTSNSFNLLNNFSILSLIYPKGWGAGSYGRIIERMKDTSPFGGYIFFLYSATTNLMFSAVGQNNVASTIPIILNKRQFVGVTISSAGIVILYMDGLPAGTGSVTITDAANLPTYIGNSYDQTRCFNGMIEETSIFSRALSPSEISQYYQWAISEPRKYWFYSPVVAGVYMDSYFYRHLMAGGK